MTKVEGMIDLTMIRPGQIDNIKKMCKGKCISCNYIDSDFYCMIDGEYKNDKDIWDTEVSYGEEKPDH